MVQATTRLEEIRRLLEEHRRGRSLTAYAREIMIAPMTLKKFLDDPAAKVVANGVEKSEGGAKAAAGHAESVGRVFGFLVNKGDKLNFDLQEAAGAFGLDTSNVHVQQGLLRARPADSFLTQDDPTLVRIVRGDSLRPPNQVRAGILAWPPYCSDRENPRASFAGSMMTRLLGALHPLSWGAPTLQVLDFHEVLTPDPLKTGRVDAIFSLYDLASRRIAGFEFVHIPGLTAPLGGLFFDGGAATRPDEGAPRWADVLDPDRFPDLRVHVVGADAGELLIRGPCAYTDDRVVPIRPEDAQDGALIEKIARRLVHAGRMFAEGEIRFGEGGGFTRPQRFAFVADAGMVERVRELYVLMRAEEPLLPSPYELPADAHRPAYPIGIAVSANSERWVEILRAALVRELFVNSGALTARSYARLLAQPSGIAVGELGDEIPPHVQLTFTQSVLDELTTFADSPDEATVRRVEQIQVDIRKTWTPNAEAAAFRETAERLLRALSTDMNKLLADQSNPSDEGDEA